MVAEAMQVPNLLHLLSSRPCSLGIHKPATLVSVASHFFFLSSTSSSSISQLLSAACLPRPAVEV